MKFIDRLKNDSAKKGIFLCVAVLVILIIGMLIRIVGIADMPNALNCDEASAGYEAFSILNYGIDRNRK